GGERSALFQVPPSVYFATKDSIQRKNSFVCSTKKKIRYFDILHFIFVIQILASIDMSQPEIGVFVPLLFLPPIPTPNVNFFLGRKQQTKKGKEKKNLVCFVNGGNTFAG